MESQSLPILKKYSPSLFLSSFCPSLGLFIELRLDFLKDIKIYSNKIFTFCNKSSASLPNTGQLKYLRSSDSEMHSSCLDWRRLFVGAPPVNSNLFVLSPKTNKGLFSRAIMVFFTLDLLTTAKIDGKLCYFLFDLNLKVVKFGHKFIRTKI